MTESERLAALERDGVRIVRVTYPDLHGVLRGKDVPIGFFAIDRPRGRPRRSARRSRRSTCATTSSRASSTASATST